jgi:hypothetical protein
LEQEDLVGSVSGISCEQEHLGNRQDAERKRVTEEIGNKPRTIHLSGWGSEWIQKSRKGIETGRKEGKKKPP